MKIPVLLSQYLYAAKKLKLAGIGSFILEEENSLKIVFVQDASLSMDNELISFISTQTGKMKSLSTGDLDSHLDLARQFLNIGKPFLFEGIGTLVKTKSGKFLFTPAVQQDEKLKTKLTATSDFSSIFFLKYSKNKQRLKLLFSFSLLLLIGVSLWVGYKFYIEKNVNANVAPSKDVPLVESVAVPTPVDSLLIKSGTGLPIEYHFIIEEAIKERAIIRYNLLKSYGLNLQLKTEDSLQYKLYFALKVLPADTLKIRDSLTALYVNPFFMKSGKVVIEQ